MRRLKLWMGACALVALLGASAAIATLRDEGGPTTAVSSTFSATALRNAELRSCTGIDGTYELFRGTYTGNVGGDPALAGTVELRVRSVLNTTKNLGWLSGDLTIRGPAERAHAKVWAVNTRGSLDGFVSGKAGKRLWLGSLTASFSRTGGFTSIQIGGGAATNTAVLSGRAPCLEPHDNDDNDHNDRPDKKTRLKVSGTIVTLTPSSIAVTPAGASAVQTCAIDASSPKTRDFHVGERVKIECKLHGSAMVLDKIKRLKNDDD